MNRHDSGIENLNRPRNSRELTANLYILQEKIDGALLQLMESDMSAPSLEQE